MNFESGPPKVENKHIVEQELRGQVFSEMTNQIILNEFEESLFDVFETGDNVTEILNEINHLSAEDQKKVLSLPWSLREKRLTKLNEQHAGDSSQIVAALLDNASQHGYTIGYHVSPYEIKKMSQNGSEEWDVIGSELDDRDDMPMAYYSLDYQNMYRKKRGEFVYMVRAETESHGSHKRDNNEKWGRANRLSIIASTSLQHIENKLVEVVKEKKTI